MRILAKLTARRLAFAQHQQLEPTEAFAGAAGSPDDFLAGRHPRKILWVSDCKLHQSRSARTSRLQRAGQKDARERERESARERRRVRIACAARRCARTQPSSGRRRQLCCTTGARENATSNIASSRFAHTHERPTEVQAPMATLTKQTKLEKLARNQIALSFASPSRARSRPELARLHPIDTKRRAG